MKPSFSVVLLAGGKSRRMGVDKRFLPWTPTVQGHPQTLLQHVIIRASELTDDIVVVTNDSLEVAPARAVTDIHPDSGSLGGIYSGLMSTRANLAFVAAADMPFIDEQLVHALLGRCKEADAVVPVIDNRPEPLHAVYRKTCTASMHARITSNRLKIAPVFKTLKTEWVSEVELRAIDPALRSFRNLNTPLDYRQALADSTG